MNRLGVIYSYIIVYFIFVINAKSVIGEVLESSNKNGLQEKYRPSFRIIAPAFLCPENGGDQIPKPSVVTVSMQTRNGQQLTYRVNLFFENLSTSKSQRNTLSIWNNVRRLERKIRKNTHNISATNQIVIENKELTTDVSYTFQIYGIDDQNQTSDPQKFTIVYKKDGGAQLQQDSNARNEQVSLLLIGSEIVYTHTPIIIEAETIWCNPITTYHMKWTMNGGEKSNVAKYLATQGKTLKIPGGLLNAGGIHNVTVEVIGDDGHFITKASMKMTVLSNGYTTKMIPDSLMTGIGKEIDLKLKVKDLDNTGEPVKILWECRLISDSTEDSCKHFLPSKNEIQTMTFISKGVYEISAHTNLKGTIKTTKSTITVSPEIIAYARIINAPSSAISSNDRFEMDAIIEDLVPNCIGEWIVGNGPGFTYFNESTIPGGLGNVSVLDIEQSFLSELVDYGNETITRNIPMVIPRRDDKFGWAGLAPNARYLFRLKVTCPEPIDENKNGIRENVTSFTDVIVSTNGPPAGQPLQVDPLTGKSLRTIFKFSTGIANDTAEDYPMRYSFFYAVDNYAVPVGQYYENMVTITDLPYSVNPIRPFYEVCDARGSCSNKIYGPNVTTSLFENITDAEFKFKMDFIKKSIENMELDTGFGTALANALTYRHFSNQKYLNDLKEIITSTINLMIENIKAKKVFIYSVDDIIKFIKYSNQIMDILKVDDKQVFSGLLQLLNGLSPQQRSRMMEEDNSMSFQHRMKRDINASTNVTEKPANETVKFQNQTELTDLQLSITGKAAWANITELMLHLENVSQLHCSDLKTTTPYKYDSNFTSVEIIHYNNLVDIIKIGKIQIPFKNYSLTTNLTLDYSKIVQNTEPKYCLSKFVIKNHNVTNESEKIYGALLYTIDIKDGHKLSRFTLPNLTDGERNFLYEIPINNKKHKADTGTFQCLIFNGGNSSEWATNLCETVKVNEKSIECKCSNFGLTKYLFTPITTKIVLLTSTTKVPKSTPIEPKHSTAASIVNNAATTFNPTHDVVTTDSTTIPTTSTETSSTTSTTSSAVIRKPPEVDHSNKQDKPNTDKSGDAEKSSPTTATTPSTPASSAPPPQPVTLPTTTAPNTVNTSAIVPTNTTTQTSTNNTIIDSNQKSGNLSVKPTVAPTIDESSTGSTAGLTAIIVLLICAIIGIICGIAYNRRKRLTNLVQEMEIPSATFRQQSPGIRYARFQDEVNMGGHFEYEAIS